MSEILTYWRLHRVSVAEPEGMCVCLEYAAIKHAVTRTHWLHPCFLPFRIFPSQSGMRVCLRLGITNLGERMLRLRTAGEEPYRPALFSASCCGPPTPHPPHRLLSLSIMYFLFLHFLPTSIYHIVSERPGPKAQDQQVRLLPGLQLGNVRLTHQKTKWCDAFK